MFTLYINSDVDILINSIIWEIMIKQSFDSWQWACTVHIYTYHEYYYEGTQHFNTWAIKKMRMVLTLMDVLHVEYLNWSMTIRYT